LIGQNSASLKNAKPFIFYKITHGDTVEWSYGLVNNKDTFNVINSGGEKSGSWIEYYYWMKKVDKYKYGMKNGQWNMTDKSWKETALYDLGTLIQDNVKVGGRLYRETKLNITRDTAVYTEYQDNSKVGIRYTIYLKKYCDKHQPFTGFGEHLINVAKREDYDENGKLTRVRMPKE